MSAIRSRAILVAAIDFYVTGAPWLNRWFGKNAIN